jgi:hypothetical protein
MPAFQIAFGIAPAALDKSADQRAAFVSVGHTRHRSHLHLNAIARWQGRTLALLNRFGAIVDLDRQVVVVRDDALRGGHNLVVSGDVVAVCATSDYSIRVYELGSGKIDRVFPLSKHKELRHLLAGRRRARAGRAFKRILRRPVIAKPLFVRGLDLVDGQLFVGFSPASIACIEAATGELVDFYQYSDDVRVCVHGLRVVGSDTTLAQSGVNCLA